MIEPSLAFQTALRAALIGSAELVALVPAANIRAGSIRATDLPSITFASFHTEFLGKAAGSQLVARVGLDLNIWAVESGADVARAIGMNVLSILIDAPEIERFSIDQYAKPKVIWLRDVQPEVNYTHGIVTLEAVLRWQV